MAITFRGIIMHRVRDYFEYAWDILNYGSRSFETFMLSRALGIHIRPVRFHGFIDTIGWNSAFAGQKSSRIYYAISGILANDARSVLKNGKPKGVIVFPSPLSPCKEVN
jgi:hypothetical protein